MKTCYIVGAGAFYGDFTPDETDLVIAADGGYSTLKSLEIRCDLLIGDMDSIASIPTDVEIIRHKVEKDETDMHLAYLEGKKRGYNTFSIYGGVGGRADHTFANYCLLCYAAENGDSITLYDSLSTAKAVSNGELKVTADIGKTVSVFAFSGISHGGTIEGLYYELKDGELTPTFPLGVSNKVIREGAKISVKDGTLLVIEEI